jgi:phosphopantetheinyl transferase (holo-ACP synthase)
VLVPAHSRKPQVIFSPDGTLAGAGLTAHLSISHDGDYLVAGVVVERD